MLACRGVDVKPRGIQVSTYHAHSRQSEWQNILDRAHTWQQCLVTISEDILTTIYDVYLKQIASYSYFSITVNEVPVYCLPILRQILTRGSLRAMMKNVGPNYDAYRRQKSPIKSCFGHKYVCIY